MKKLNSYPLLFFTSILFSCASEDRDDSIITVPSKPIIGDTNSNTTSQTSVEATTNLHINDFIWEGLNTYYYWQSDVDDLDDSKTNNSADYTNFLGKFSDPSDFFDSLKYKDDRFSWIVDDYEDLENQLAGISASNGMKFIPFIQCSGCTKVNAMVTYVLPDSDASAKGIERGDIVITIDGISINIDNYRELLYGDDMTYNVGLGEYNQNTQTYESTGESVVLDKVENFQENPIQKNIVLEEGNRRVGYLMYNKFSSGPDSEFDNKLVEVFLDFASQNVTDLVLDLRYNGGGSIRTCLYLASMITGQFTGDVFAQQIWNSKLMEYFNSLNNNSDPDDDFELNDYFTNSTTDGVSLPGLNLTTLYVLTTNRSASASEMLINGLASHINVIQIGGTTVGKNVGSITLYDYSDVGTRVKDTTHRYAMQPIVLKIANSVNYADYNDGLTPDIELRESPYNLGVLGSPSELFLSEALNRINGSGKHIIFKENSTIYLQDPEFDLINSMHIDFPQGKLKNLLKSQN